MIDQDKYDDIYCRAYYYQHRGTTVLPVMKFQDQLASLAYSFGMSSYWDIEKLFGLKQWDSMRFRHNANKGMPEHLDREFPKQVKDSILLDITLPEQIKRILSVATRRPKKVLDVGGGMGDLCICFSAIGIDSILLEPASCTDELLIERKAMLALPELMPIEIAHDPTEVSWQGIDTAIFCASIEHIYQEDFIPLLDRIRDTLQATNGRLIIAGTLNYFPIQTTGRDHVAQIDDTSMDRVERTMEGTTAFRHGSHLVIDC